MFHTATLLSDGRVLVAGGGYQATAETFRLDPDGAQCSTWATCESGRCVDGVCCDSACDDGCRSCAIPGFEGICLVPCVDDTRVLSCEGSGVGCTPYRCEQAEGPCGARCGSFDDCAPGFVCDLEHHCGPPLDTRAREHERHEHERHEEQHARRHQRQTAGPPRAAAGARGSGSAGKLFA